MECKTGILEEFGYKWPLCQAVSRFETPDPIMEMNFFKDNRPNKHYTGISVDVESFRQNSTSDAEFWNMILSLLN